MDLNDLLNAAGASRQFVSISKLEENLAKQINVTATILETLRHLEEKPSESLRLEFFFYTNAAGKAYEFKTVLEKKGYSVEYGKSAGTENLFLITGWTTKVSMAEETVISWAKEMCELGYAFDCEFDGWGTTPDQD